MMANRDDRYGIKFIWKIRNFSWIKSGILQSPSFPWKSTMWEVIIHLPDAMTDFHSYNVELRQIKFNRLALFCSIAFLDSQDFPLVWKEAEESFYHSIVDYVHFKNFMKIKDMFGPKRGEFLPNDILTVQCHLWVNSGNHQFIENLPLMGLTQIHPLPRVSNLIFTWNILDVMSVPCNAELKREDSTTINGRPLVVKLRLVCSDIGEWKIVFTVSLFRILLDASVSVVETSGIVKQLVKEKFSFEKNRQEWNLGTTLTKHKLHCYPNPFLRDGTLSLHFSCTLSGNVTFNGLVEEFEAVNNDLPNTEVREPDDASNDEDEASNESDHSATVSKAFESLYEEGFLSDFNLKVGDRLFPVHKAVLGIRSPVFRAMFTNEMKEKQDNCSAIEDVDGDTLQRLLQFVYSDKVEDDLSWESASSLYEAADKYDLETLKQRCSDLLRSCLSVDNALHVLTLADMHQDQELKLISFDFILMNDEEIVCSKQWNKFVEENPKLATDTFKSLFIHLKTRQEKDSKNYFPNEAIRA